MLTATNFTAVKMCKGGSSGQSQAARWKEEKDRREEKKEFRRLEKRRGEVR
jgi:hypothetical protein